MNKDTFALCSPMDPVSSKELLNLKKSPMVADTKPYELHKPQDPLSTAPQAFLLYQQDQNLIWFPIPLNIAPRAL